MRVFLTGASGFVGSFFLRNLLFSGDYDVTILLRSKKDAWRIQDLLPKVQVISGGLERLDLIEIKLSDARPDVFIHLAWNGVSGGERNNSSQWQNVCYTLKLVEIAHKLGASKFIGLGSQAEYGTCQHKIDELTHTNPTTLYGASKLAAQILSQKLCQDFGIKYTWLRLFSSYGPADNPKCLIPYLIRTLIEKRRPSLTAAEQIWDFIYIEDVASALRAVLDYNNAQGVFNLGSGIPYSIKNVIEKIRDFIDPTLTLGFGEIDYRPDQVMHLEADISALSRATNWSPQISLDDGIAATVAWYQINKALYAR